LPRTYSWPDAAVSRGFGAQTLDGRHALNAAPCRPPETCTATAELATACSTVVDDPRAVLAVACLPTGTRDRSSRPSTVPSREIVIVIFVGVGPPSPHRFELSTTPTPGDGDRAIRRADVHARALANRLEALETWMLAAL